MRTQHNHARNIEATYLHNIPVIDGEFDGFEMNTDLMAKLCGTEVADFYQEAQQFDALQFEE